MTWVLASNFAGLRRAEAKILWSEYANNTADHQKLPSAIGAGV
jgi:hypothetical protein